jgi:hypothetical protein
VGRLGPDGTFNIDLGLEGSSKQKKFCPSWDDLSTLEIELNTWSDATNMPNHPGVMSHCVHRIEEIKAELLVLAPLPENESRSEKKKRVARELRVGTLLGSVEEILSSCARQAVEAAPTQLMVVQQVHEGFECSACHEGPISGVRYLCQDCPGDINFCAGCFGLHAPVHLLTLFRVPVPVLVSAGHKWEINKVLGMRKGESFWEFNVVWKGPWKNTWETALDLSIPEEDMLNMVPRKSRLDTRRKRLRLVAPV